MNKKRIIVGILLPVIVGGFFLLYFERPQQPSGAPAPVTPLTMQISSPSFKNNEIIPSKFTCDGENINPELVFSEVPANAGSLVLIVHDPDAPRQGGWTHWIVINMDPSTTGIKENSLPDSGLETATDFGKPGYGGPCPPSGSHRYFFNLYALDTGLELGPETDKPAVELAMQGHILKKAELVGLYQRK